MKKIVYFILMALLGFLSLSILSSGISSILNQELYKEAGITVGYDVGVITGIVGIVLFAVILILLTINLICYFASEHKDKPTVGNSVLLVIASCLVGFNYLRNAFSGFFTAKQYESVINTATETDSFYYSMKLMMKNSISSGITALITLFIVVGLTILYLASKREETK